MRAAAHDQDNRLTGRPVYGSVYVDCQLCWRCCLDWWPLLKMSSYGQPWEWNSSCGSCNALTDKNSALLFQLTMTQSAGSESIAEPSNWSTDDQSIRYHSMCFPWMANFCAFYLRSVRSVSLVSRFLFHYVSMTTGCFHGSHILITVSIAGWSISQYPSSSLLFFHLLVIYQLFHLLSCSCVDDDDIAELRAIFCITCWYVWSHVIVTF